MNLLYQITGHVNFVVRADSYEEAGDIARDVAQELPNLRDTEEIDVEINVLAEPTGKGYCYPTEPTIKRRLKLQ
jgi:hypothetical protein